MKTKQQLLKEASLLKQKLTQVEKQISLTEVKRMQQLAGITKESQLNEVNEPEKAVIAAILGTEGGKYVPGKIASRLIGAAKKELLTTDVVDKVLSRCKFDSSVENNIKNELKKYKTVDSDELDKKEKDGSFKKHLDSFKMQLKAMDTMIKTA